MYIDWVPFIRQLPEMAVAVTSIWQKGWLRPRDLRGWGAVPNIEFP